MPRRIAEKDSGASKTRSPRAIVGTYPVLNPVTRSKVGSVKLAKAVKNVWEEKKTTASSHASKTTVSSAKVRCK